MQFPALFGQPDPEMELRRLLRGYGLALLFVAALHLAGWLWTRKPPVETPVIVPPMVDVELITPPKVAQTSAPAPAPAPTARPAPAPPKKAETPPKPKPKPAVKPTPKTVEKPKPLRETTPEPPAEHAEVTRPVPKPAAAPPASAPSSASSSSASSQSSASSRGAGQAPGAKGSGGSDQKVSPAHDAGYLHNPKPKYPAVAIARNWEGLVRLRVYVLPNGTAGQVVLHQSSGHGALDEAALDVVQRWRFVPAKRGEQAIASWVVVPLVFKLNAGR